MDKSKKMKNILITGGAGFIGSNLSLYLLNKGYKITVLDNLSKQIHGDTPHLDSPLFKSIYDKVHFIQGCITNPDIVEKAIFNQDVIVHFAAETGTGQSMYEIDKYVNVNIKGTSVLLDILVNKQHSVKKVVVASSRSIYGEGRYYCKKCGYVYPKHRTDDYLKQNIFDVKHDSCQIDELKLVSTDEESKIHPSSVYGITKQVQEQLIMTVCPTINIAPVALRYQNVFGPGQSLKNPYTGILSIFSTQIKNGNIINIFEDGKESRDFVFIDDVVEATFLAIESDKANGEVFNVGTGIPTDVIKVATLLLNYYKSAVNYKITGNYRVGDIRHNFADMKKIKEKIGFSPKYSFEVGLKKFADWVDSQNIEVDNYNKSVEEMKLRGLYK